MLLGVFFHPAQKPAVANSNIFFLTVSGEWERPLETPHDRFSAQNFCKSVLLATELITIRGRRVRPFLWECAEMQ